MPSAEIRAAVERNAGNPEAAVRELIAAANRAGGKDNVTVLVVEGEQFTAPRRVRRGRDAQRTSCRALLLFVGGLPAGRGGSAGSRARMWQPAPVDDSCRA